MIYIYIILFCVISVIIFFNINYLVSLINNIYIKPKINIFFILFIISSITYTVSRFNLNSFPLIDFSLWIIYYVLLFINLYIINRCSFKRIIYIFLLYLSIDSILQSVLYYIADTIPYHVDSLLLTFVISLIICCIISIILKILTSKRTIVTLQPNIIPVKIYILILLALIFSGGLIENQLTVTNIQVQSTFNKSFTIITIFLLIFIIVSLVFNCISKAYFENVSSILEKQVNAQVDYYKKVDKLNKDLRDFRHDYKNHMICVQGLLDAHQYDEAREYVHGITLRKTILSKEFASGNSIADALLSDKAERAEEIGAELQFKGVIFEDIPSVDLCTILSNALDNAIEACEKISSDEQKIISVKCSYIKHIQFIWISNPVAEDVKIINNTVETSKADKNIHGIGLYNIRRTVAKYEGEFEISCNDKMFVMDIGFKVD